MGFFGNLGSGAAFTQALQYMGLVSNGILAFNNYKVDGDESELFASLAQTLVATANVAGIKKPLSDAQLAMLTGHIAGIIDLFEKD